MALSGGGSKGAYEAGAVWQLAHSLAPEDVTWDVVSGVSAGALNSAGMSIFAVGEELAMSDWLIKLWSSISTKDIFHLWPEGFVYGFLHESGIFDDTPLFNLLTTIFN